jgi:hypothetical protein
VLKKRLGWSVIRRSVGPLYPGDDTAMDEHSASDNDRHMAASHYGTISSDKPFDVTSLCFAIVAWVSL